MNYLSIPYTLLSMQSALLGEVTSELRAVRLNLDVQKEILYVRFYYDGKSTEKMIDLWQCAITEASAHLGQCFVESEVERLDFPKKIPDWGYLAYLRQEPFAYEKPRNRVKIEEKTIGYALVAVQQALLGVITPELRTVIVDFEKETNFLYIRFYYDGEVPEEVLALWQNTITQSVADFGSDCILDAAIERVDYPQKYPFRGRYAFLRKEERNA
jgi:hypothetical protein